MARTTKDSGEPDLFGDQGTPVSGPDSGTAGAGRSAPSGGTGALAIPDSADGAGGDDQLTAMMRDYYLDYASYVILDRAVPYYEDGLKPVQRRILYTLWEKNDGRYHKVANLVGHCMQYHPHGDASIGDALVNLGQKGLLIDPQGNWGNVLTGDGAAAPRYIEGRLTPFAVETMFGNDITHWVPSYDGRAEEPLFLPARFPLLLAQGTEGIAVGLATTILPHNFDEILEGCVAILRKRSFELYPDFQTGGLADCSDYNDGARGGRVKVRAVIEVADRKTLRITEIPYGTTTASLIASIREANDKGKIRIKSVDDNTARDVEIVVHLPAGVDPLQTMEALYTFTDCEVSISVNCCVVVDKHPCFMDVKTLLRRNVEYIVELLRWDLSNKLNALEKTWHTASLEQIFIENGVYEVIKKAESADQMVELVGKGMLPHLKKLRAVRKLDRVEGVWKIVEAERILTRDDILHLCKIPIQRISRFDSAKTRDLLAKSDADIAETVRALEHLTDYAVAWFRHLQKKYSAQWPRRTKLEQFHTVAASRVAAANLKMYVDRAGGFIGTSLKKDEFVFECSPYDEVIVFRKDAVAQVVKVSEKCFVGKDVVHLEVFDRKDERRVYSMVYQDGKDGRTYAKRFQMGGITRDKEYALSKETKGSKVFYFKSSPNGECDLVQILLKPRPRIKTEIEQDFGELEIKGRSSTGKLITKYPVRAAKAIGEGTSAPMGQLELWWQPGSPVATMEKVGRSIGFYEDDDFVLVVRNSGRFQVFPPAGTVHVGPDILYIGKLSGETVYTALAYDGESLAYYLKRFTFSELISGREYTLIGDNPANQMLLFSDAEDPKVVVEYLGTGKAVQRELLDAPELCEPRNWKAKGWRFSKARKIRRAGFAPEGLLDGTIGLEAALKEARVYLGQ